MGKRDHNERVMGYEYNSLVDLVVALKDFKAFYFVLVDLFDEFIKVIEFNFGAKIFFHINTDRLTIDFLAKIEDIHFDHFLFAIYGRTKANAHHALVKRVVSGEW